MPNYFEMIVNKNHKKLQEKGTNWENFKSVKEFVRATQAERKKNKEVPKKRAPEMKNKFEKLRKTLGI